MGRTVGMIAHGYYYNISLYGVVTELLYIFPYPGKARTRSVKVIS